MFRTELHPKKPCFSIGLQDNLITVGSCFSEVIGERLKRHKFEALSNPFGVIFHPQIASRLLQMALNGTTPGPETFLQLDGRWLSYLLHSRINASSQQELHLKLQQLFSEVQQTLQKAEVLMLTAGTAFYYVQEAQQLAVANCHKQPQKHFRKVLSPAEEILQGYESLYEQLKAVNPEIQLILTLSPVRHLKDSLELNSVSKATLRLAIHQFCEAHPEVSYFPSYELLLDDLRDYRFYGRDLLHPSEEAEEYIWQKFTATYLNEEALDFVNTWQRILQALEHRPFNPQSEAHQKFLRITLQKLEKLSSQVDLRQEISKLQKQLI